MVTNIAATHAHGELLRELFGSDDDDNNSSELGDGPDTTAGSGSPPVPECTFAACTKSALACPQHPFLSLGLVSNAQASTAPTLPQTCLNAVFSRSPRVHFTIVQPPTIAGLVVIKGALCRHLQAHLLHTLVSLGYFSSWSQNQLMHFGGLPQPLAWLETLYRAWGSVLFPATCTNSTAIMARQPLFDQLIGNMYQPGEGIRPHVDLARFDDGIGIVSLASHCTMVFAPADPVSTQPPVTLVLEPGDILAMTGDARYAWTHAIPGQAVDMVEGQPRYRSTRISLTLRRVHSWACQGPSSSEL
ncbi:hypothetical protein H4R35_001134 [Dimargaris xerosporica]|nr:hypothetical protein H4R35_001134 [Dimargaris xerosporica]